jgi:hypothetical protein
MKLNVVTTCLLVVVMSALTLTSASAQEWIKNNANTVTRLKNQKHNVGVGTTAPKEKLTVVGAVQHDGVSNTDGTEKRYPTTLKRYHIAATKASVDKTVPLNNTHFRQLCRDRDGCLVTLGMRDWSDAQPNATVTVGPYRFYLATTGTTFRKITDPVDLNDQTLVKQDKNDIAENALQAWGCFLTDGEFENRVGTDSTIGFGLLNLSGVGFDDPDMVCELTIDD